MQFFHQLGTAPEGHTQFRPVDNASLGDRSSWPENDQNYGGAHMTSAGALWHAQKHLFVCLAAHFHCITLYAARSTAVDSGIVVKGSWVCLVSINARNR